MKDEVDATSNLIKDIEISEVDELPEDDDDFKVPESSISRMASELGDIDLYHPERKLTPLKKGKGKRKKQVTPMRPVKEVSEAKHKNKKQMKKTNNASNEVIKVQEGKSKTGRGGKKKEKKAKAPRKTKVKKQKKIVESSEDEDEWAQEKLHPLQQYQQDLPIPPRSTKRATRRRKKVISYADLDDSEDDYFQ